MNSISYNLSARAGGRTAPWNPSWFAWGLSVPAPASAVEGVGQCQPSRSCPTREEDMRKSVSQGSLTRLGSHGSLTPKTLKHSWRRLASRSMLDMRSWIRRASKTWEDDGLPLYSPGSTVPSFFQGLLPTAGTLITCAVVLGWYFSNIGVLVLNKYLLSSYKYKYPIFLTMMHMLSCSLYSLVFVRIFRIVKPQAIVSGRQFLKILALSLIFCLSVVAGNVSLRYLPVSFNQAVGATGPFFTAVLSVLMTRRKESTQVYLTLIPVVLGVVIASRGEPLFSAFGVTMVLISTSCRACKSVLQGILLSNESERLNSMNLLMYMAPIAFVALVPLSLVFEGDVLSLTLSRMAEHRAMVGLLAANVSVAYGVNLMNFMVTKHTSALTLQVLGNAKAGLAVIVSVAIFRNPVTMQGVAGFVLTLLGVILYSEAKRKTARPKMVAAVPVLAELPPLADKRDVGG